MNKFLLAALPCALAFSVNAQQGAPLTAKDYERAESFLSYGTEPLVDNNGVRPEWLPNGTFWYRNLGAHGAEFFLVNPAKGTRTAAFDHQKLAAALSKTAGTEYTGTTLPFNSISYSADGKSVIFEANGKQWAADLDTYKITEDNSAVAGGGRGRGGRPGGRRGGGIDNISPDGKKAAFIRDWNLWVRDLDTKKETQLTTDGVKDYGYATDNAGWKHSDAAILIWSADSKKIATFKQDQRKVKDMYLVTTNVGNPTLKAWKYPLPGDKDIAMIQRCIIDVDHPKVIMTRVAPDPHRATLSDDIASSGTLDDIYFSSDNSKLAFVSTSRDHKNEKVRIADANTGEVREVFEETVKTQFESGQGGINWRYLDKSNEIIWYSERDNWGHLYLYDATTGKLKNQITKGDFVVTRLLKVDEKNRMLYFLADGRQSENPYFTQFCKIGFDGKHFANLTPEPGMHQVQLSPGGNYFIDTYSKPDVPGVTVLRDMNGKMITELEKTDVSRLEATGWKPVKPFSVKAHDGTTDIYGLMFTPTKMQQGKKYPVIDYIYPGPQGGSIGGNWGFSASRGDNQALAELGFVVVLIEGTSNPLRSKSFHDMSYGDMAQNTLADQVGGIRQLAQRFDYIDTTRVGIWGHSGGGFATAGAMFRFPDFFKVGIAESGNHENLNYEDDWGERYDGLVTNSNYAAQANQNIAKNLKGKLMLAHGLLDDNVPPYNTLLVIEALEKAGKDYDLVVFPNSPHGYGQYSSYMMRRRWDYFVRNLLGVEPPHEYVLKAKSDPRNSGGR